MVKVKHKQMGALATKKGKPAESSNTGIEGDLHGDDEWVIVKKQKVTILIPPLALPIQKPRQVLRTHQISTKLRKTIRRRKCSGGDSTYSFHERSFATAPGLTRKFTRPTLKNATEGPKRLVGESTLQLLSSNFVHDHHSRGFSKTFRVSGVSKAAKRPTASQSTCHQGPTLFLRPIGCLNGVVLQNRMMRASNLERKLEKAGGVSRWLISLGLGRFVNMFRRKNVDKFQLLNLTMEKLKEMGANAVGPRRKLMHAIDCLSQPYCFSTF